MVNTYLSIEIERCEHTKECVLNILKEYLCTICGKIPLPAYKNLNITYCGECILGKKINAELSNLLELTNLLIINCKNNCGKQFTYTNINELLIHEKNHDIENTQVDTLDDLKLEANLSFKNKIELFAHQNDRLFSKIEEFTDKFEKKFEKLEKNLIILQNKLNKPSKNDTDFPIVFKDQLNEILQKIKKNNESSLNNFNTVAMDFINEKIEHLFQNLNKKLETALNNFNEIKKEISYPNDIEFKNVDCNNDFSNKSRNIEKINTINSETRFDKFRLPTDFNSKFNSLLNQIPNNQTFSAIIQSDNLPDYSFEELIKLNDRILNSSDYLSFKYQSKILETRLNHLRNHPMSFLSIQNVIISEHENIVNEIITHELDNKSLIITASQNSIKFWDAGTNTCKKTIKDAHKDWICSFLILKNTLISSGMDTIIRFWDINNFTKLPDEIDNKFCVNRMIKDLVNPDVFIVASDDKIIKYYNIYTRNVEKLITTDHSDYIYRIVLIKSNEKHLLISGSNDSSIKIWGENGCCINILKNSHSRRIDSMIHLDYDDNIMVSGDSDGNIIFWKVDEDFKLIRRLNHYNENIKNDNNLCLCEIKGQSTLVSTTRYSSITFWNLANYQVIRNLSLIKGIKYLRVLENNEGLIFNIGQDIIIWK